MRTADRDQTSAWPGSGYDRSVPPFRRMLVALADQASADELLAYTAMLRRVLCCIEILCVHVRPNPEAVDSPRDAIEHRIRTHLLQASCEWIVGDLLDSILDHASARSADLILLGHSQSGRRRR